MSDTDPIIEIRPVLERRAEGRPARPVGGNGQPSSGSGSNRTTPPVTAFSRQELQQILRVYGRMVAAGEWRDYALDLGHETASFSVFRRASENPLYRIEKTPKLARRQGAFSVVSAAGVVLKRGSDLARVLSVLDSKLRLVEG